MSKNILYDAQIIDELHAVYWYMDVPITYVIFVLIFSTERKKYFWTNKKFIHFFNWEILLEQDL